MRSQYAFTLVELLVTVSIATILMVSAVPAFLDLVHDHRLYASLSDLHLGLRLARSEAIKTSSDVVVCKSGNGTHCLREGRWDQGWIGFTDPDRNDQCGDEDGDGRCDSDGGKIFLVQEPLGRPGQTLRGNRNIAHRVVFDGRGYSDGYPGTFTACDSRGLIKARGLVLSIVGRIRPATSADAMKCDE